MTTARAEATRAAIVDAALRMFREQGYEATTMRAIAREAGVATGNAYYYFGSKEELIQEFYARNHAAHLAASRPVLDTETGLAARLRGCCGCWSTSTSRTTSSRPSCTRGRPSRPAR